MKKLSSYNRAAGYLNKRFDLLNEEYFESELVRPTITIQSTPKAFGHFSLRDDTWVSVTGSTHEINIGAGTLARPIESVVTTMLHEMVHYHNYCHGVQDCSRGGTYHNRRFRDACLIRDMLVTHPLIGMCLFVPLSFRRSVMFRCGNAGTSCFALWQSTLLIHGYCHKIASTTWRFCGGKRVSRYLE